MSIDEPISLTSSRPLIEAHLDRLQHIREQNATQAPVSEDDCSDLVHEIRSVQEQDPQRITDGSSSNFAVLETVFREVLVTTIASCSISDPPFSKIWILLDVVNVLSDHGLCEPSLGFWLVEELLDSQTIDGCRKVFDFLESRRERMVKENFQKKHLAILRCCNELLRRLSRAEDTVFCGRVFIFMFQSFPLGDRSSVNLRGEFHVENVTTFDPAPQKSEDAIKPMEIDPQGPQATRSGSATPSSTAIDSDRPQTAGRSTPANRKDVKAEEPMDLDSLYPKFWSLQSYFSNPTKLFDPAQMASFKDGIAATLSCFQNMTNISAPSTRPEDVKRGIKRRRSEMSMDYSTFNPKYLTNRDLFDLEIHDIAFRRHILVQALIMIDFLLGLTPTAKSKLANLSNQSVLYPYTLSPEDTKWASSTKSRIAEYLQQGPGTEGKSYYRMVDTVLSRDKNWVRWKAENCPSITREPVPPEQQSEARQNLQNLTRKQPLPPPTGATDLEFLNKSRRLEDLIIPAGGSDGDHISEDQDTPHHRVPSMREFYDGIRMDELDGEMGTEEEMREAKERAAAKLWRALRASGRRFELCEKIEGGRNLKALVGGRADDEGREGQDDVGDGDAARSENGQLTAVNTGEG